MDVVVGNAFRFRIDGCYIVYSIAEIIVVLDQLGTLVEKDRCIIYIYIYMKPSAFTGLEFTLNINPRQTSER